LIALHLLTQDHAALAGLALTGTVSEICKIAGVNRTQVYERKAQLTKAFVEENYAGKPERRPNVCFVGFTQYYDEFQDFMLGSMSAGGSMNKLLGEIISNAGLKQLRIAETRKI